MGIIAADMIDVNNFLSKIRETVGNYRKDSGKTPKNLYLGKKEWEVAVYKFEQMVEYYPGTETELRKNGGYFYFGVNVIETNKRTWFKCVKS